MVKIINFNAFKEKQELKALRQKEEIIEHPGKQEIIALIKRAQLIKGETDGSSEEIRCIEAKNIKNFFEGKISGIIFDQKHIAAEYFLCGIYVSTLLTELIKRSGIPESWFAIDYWLGYEKSGDPEYLKRGADACFLINSVFKERGGIRCMNYDDYVKFGQGLYRQFYNHTGKEIAYHMHVNYGTMVGITDECIKNL